MIWYARQNYRLMYIRQKKTINDNKQFCEIEYLSEEENEEYDIIHNPEKFILHVDGEKVE